MATSWGLWFVRAAGEKAEARLRTRSDSESPGGNVIVPRPKKESADQRPPNALQFITSAVCVPLHCINTHSHTQWLSHHLEEEEEEEEDDDKKSEKECNKQRPTADGSQNHDDHCSYADPPTFVFAAAAPGLEIQVPAGATGIFVLSWQ